MPSALDFVKRVFGRSGEKPKPLSRSVVKHDSIDRMAHANYMDESPRFKRVTAEEAPQIAPNVQHPDPIDFTTAAPEEIVAWQQAEREAKMAEDDAPPYDGWPDLTRDIFYSYHHVKQPELLPEDEIDPAVRTHAKLLHRLTLTDEHLHSRNDTKDDAVMAAYATMFTAPRISEMLTDELREQAQQAQEFTQQRDRAEGHERTLEALREEAREHHAQGNPVPQDLVDAIKDSVRKKRDAQARAGEIAANPTPFSYEAQKRIEEIAKGAQEAVEQAAGMPSFGQGFGAGEPVYESPEQALTIAEMWTQNEQLRAMASLFGKLKLNMEALRAKRVVGGQDEIVDVEMGDELRRVTAAELGMLADEELEDDFYARYLAGELMVYSTVGEERADMGPIGLVVDGSGTMTGERNIWARAVAMALLNIARKEKRDFFMVEFASAGQQKLFSFPAKEALDAQRIVDMASHFFGGGTQPLAAIAKAATYMAEVPVFKKADLCVISDGEARFGDEDRRYRDSLRAKGVRVFGIGIGRSFGYLKNMCEDGLVSIHDFELADPNAATAMLATHIQ